MNNYKEMKQIARLSAEFLGEPWVAIDTEVRQGEEILLRASSRRLAEYLARLHNFYLILVRSAMMLAKKEQDRKQMEKEMECTKED